MSGKDDVTTAANAGVKLTYEDYLQFPDDGKRHELIDGEHYVTPTPTLRHQIILGNVLYFIRRHLETHPSGHVFPSPLDVILSKYDVVEPDVLYVSKERGKEILDKWVMGAPDLAIEITSPSTRKRDETIKRRLYERWNVLEYWVVDTDIDVVKVYRRKKTRFDKPLELSREAGDVLTTPLLQGLELPLSKIFED